MKLSEIRSLLLREHAVLRKTLDETQRAAEQWERGERSRDALQTCLGRLSSEVRSHNLHEEELLREIIPTIDAWGPVRADIMMEQHVEEHRELYDALVEASTTGDARVATRAILTLNARMVEHMDHEEATFLGDDILRDELGPPTDYFGG